MIRPLTISLGLGITLLSARVTSAQSYSIDWFTINGGGGTSSGGIYTLSGTIGQTDAGRMTGGNYTLEGGFWAGVIAVQTPGAPLLDIVPGLGGAAMIFWSPATPGFVLQVSDSLTTPNWADAPSGASNPATVSTAVGMTKFYRLRKPVAFAFANVSATGAPKPATSGVSSSEQSRPRTPRATPFLRQVLSNPFPR